MNSGQRTVASLLGVVAVILALNLVGDLLGQEYSSSRPYVLQTEAEQSRPPPPTVVQINDASRLVVRLWSDGLIETMDVTPLFVCQIVPCDWQTVPAGAPQPGARIVQIESLGRDLLRLWSNGVVEMNQALWESEPPCFVPVWCGWQVLPG